MIRATFKEVQTHLFFYNVIKICTVQLKCAIKVVPYTTELYAKVSNLQYAHIYICLDL